MDEILQDETIPLDSQAAIVKVRQEVRNWAKELKLGVTDQTKIVTAASELARNTFDYAVDGECRLEIIRRGMKKGLHLIFRDQGPGIEDLDRAMSPGYTTYNGLGMGLPGSRKLADEFDIASEKGKGTTITLIKWAL